MTIRQYRMIRLGKGDYLLPSNDARTLWRLCVYEEDGSAQNYQGRIVKGSYWLTARWAGGFPTDNQLAADLEADEWTHWEFWSGPFDTRQEAIEDALAS